MTNPSFTQLVLASSNTGKLREFGALLADIGVEVLPQSALAIPDAEETGLTFVENALLKARAAAQHSGLAALADDSGLVVPALGGAPGIYSARYSGVHGGGTDRNAANNRKLLEVMAQLRGSERNAYYICILVLLRSAEDPVPVICEGRWWGRIATQASGEHGFGYDPVFELPELGCTAAELDPVKKNRISHRGIASAALLASLQRDSH